MLAVERVGRDEVFSLTKLTFKKKALFRSYPNLYFSILKFLVGCSVSFNDSYMFSDYFHSEVLEDAYG